MTNSVPTKLVTFEFSLNIHNFGITLRAPEDTDTEKVQDVLLQAIQLEFSDRTLAALCPEVRFDRHLDYDAIVHDGAVELESIED